MLRLLVEGARRCGPTRSRQTCRRSDPPAASPPPPSYPLDHHLELARRSSPADSSCPSVDLTSVRLTCPCVEATDLVQLLQRLPSSGARAGQRRSSPAARPPLTSLSLARLVKAIPPTVGGLGRVAPHREGDTGDGQLLELAAGSRCAARTALPGRALSSDRRPARHRRRCSPVVDRAASRATSARTRRRQTRRRRPRTFSPLRLTTYPDGRGLGRGRLADWC